MLDFSHDVARSSLFIKQGDRRRSGRKKDWDMERRVVSGAVGEVFRYIGEARGGVAIGLGSIGGSMASQARTRLLSASHITRNEVWNAAASSRMVVEGALS